MRHVVALLLTIVTSAISAALTAITFMAGCVLWPPIVLLCAVSGYLCRRSPLSFICYAFPFTGLPLLMALEVMYNGCNRTHARDYAAFPVLLFPEPS